MKSALSPLLIVLQLLLLSCIQHEDGKLEVTPGYWGNLTTLNDFPESKLFLINLTKKQSYRICLPKYLTEKFDGIENEIRASVQIWGYYIGREINLTIDVVDLPELDSRMRADKILSAYSPLCPKNSNLIIGEAFFSDKTIGKTTYRYWKDSKGKETKSIRGLFLKSSGPDDEKKWITLSQYLKKPLTEFEILEILKSRDKIFYLDEAPAHITLVTLVHEIGHVWGMCDQYDLGLGTTNCDEDHSSLDDAEKIHLDLESIMSSSSWVNKIFLTDDDIEGIRHLANREEFVHEYPTGDEIKKIVVTKRPDQEKIPALNLKSVTIVGEGVTFDFSLVTTVPITISYKYFEENSKKYTVKFDDKLDAPIKESSYQYTGNFKSNQKFTWDRFEITFQPMDDDGKPVGDPFLIEYKVPEEPKEVP